ncbi:MAG: VWA domain-containing protein [Actinomycetota bacterium]|nr:VWA domain-containing protein [Actinomycetota bacterium]
MQIKTNELINFSHYCSENSLKFPSERISNLIKFLQKAQHDKFERDISFIYSLLPSNKEEKEKLKELIHQYFNFIVGDYKDESSFLLDYKYERVEDFFNDNSLSRFQKLADDIINQFGEIDFSRPVSNNYWLNQLQKSLTFLDAVSFFDIDFDNGLDKIINEENKNYFINQLNQSILERVSELRNQFKEAYIPSELNPKENLEEKDFLFTDAEERRKLLKETRNLGLILANKFVKYTKSASKGKLLFRKTIRKSLKNGGSLYDIVLKPKIKKKPRLILLCDISGSMALYSLFGLTLLFGVVQRFKSVHAFVFIDGITDITKELKNLKFNNINKILTNWNNYVHVDGHSDYDKSFKDLLDEKIISNSSFNTLIVIGDARNNYRPINTETIDKLSKEFQNVYWMNPERSQYWNTGDSQFHRYQSISKKYSEVRNFEQLKSFINSINFKKVIK